MEEKALAILLQAFQENKSRGFLQSTNDEVWWSWSFFLVVSHGLSIGVQNTIMLNPWLYIIPFVHERSLVPGLPRFALLGSLPWKGRLTSKSDSGTSKDILVLWHSEYIHLSHFYHFPILPPTSKSLYSSYLPLKAPPQHLPYRIYREWQSFLCTLVVPQADLSAVPTPPPPQGSVIPALLL